jgi:hypothetical protein
MIEAGHYYTLKVKKTVDFGVYLDGDTDEILLPKRYVPDGLNDGDEINVFVYHDNEGRLIATTDKPLAVVGEVAMLEVADVAPFGAFLKWGIMKDVFIPVSLQERKMRVGEKRLVRLFVDEQTGRVTASEKIDRFLSNYELTVKENEEVDIVFYQKTDIGYKVIVNNKHLGVVHYNEMFKDVDYGERMRGFVKKVRTENKLDISPGVRGYARVKTDEEKILELLQEHDGYLPYHDKSDAEEIYAFFGMSKKAFKMAVGALYKKRQIELTTTGIRIAAI